MGATLLKVARQETIHPAGAGGNPRGPAWAVHLLELCVVIRQPANRRALSKAQGEAWLILNAALCRYLRVHTVTRGAIGREDQEDIAAQKSLDLLERIRTGKWDVNHRAPSEIAGFLSTIARNALIDQRKREVRRVKAPREDEEAWDSDAISARAVHMDAKHAADQENRVESKAFASVLRGCAEQLSTRARRIWFFRVFLEMPSKAIATHPEISIRANTVDVILMRCRKAIRECMQAHGFEPGDMPPGTFVELWRAFEFEKMLESGEG